jgi:predicted RecB family nuclease
MALKRDFPYVWVTWVAKLMSAEDMCEWAYWFRSNHVNNSYGKVPADFDAVRWQMIHTGLVNKTRSRYESEGYEVSIRNQNLVKLKGESAILSGIPDIVAVDGDQYVVIDVKTGQPSSTHLIQVMIYMYAVSKSRHQARTGTLMGKVVYDDHEIDIPHSAVDEEFVSRLSKVVLGFSKRDEPRRTPSKRECGFCCITENDCPDRLLQLSSKEELNSTNDF